MVEDQPVYQTPSANLAVAFNASLWRLKRSELTLWRRRFKLMRSEIGLHIVCLLQCTAITLVAMLGASIRTMNALNIRVVDHTSTEVPGAIMKLTPAMMALLIFLTHTDKSASGRIPL
jgi:hypothetical protein